MEVGVGVEEQDPFFATLTPLLAAMQELQHTVVQERKALTAELEQVGLKVVDHAMWRVAQLVAVSLAVVWCAGVVSLFLVRWIFFGRTLGSRNGHAAG